MGKLGQILSDLRNLANIFVACASWPRFLSEVANRQNLRQIGTRICLFPDPPATANRQPNRKSAQASRSRQAAANGMSRANKLSTMSNSGDKSRSKRRREAKLKQKDEALEKEYAGMTFVKRPSSGRPATPHRHFESSYEGRTTSTSTSTGGDDTPKSPSEERGQVIHRHANGLCVVTAGDIIKEACSKSDSITADDESNTSVTVRQVDFRIAPAKGQSVGSKRRKRMGKNPKKKRCSENDDNGDCDGNETESGATRPSDVLAVVELSCGTSVELKCCALGTLLEINSRLVEKPSLLLTDPLLDGYLAVIMPRGRIPTVEE